VARILVIRRQRPPRFGAAAGGQALGYDLGKPGNARVSAPHPMLHFRNRTSCPPRMAPGEFPAGSRARELTTGVTMGPARRSNIYNGGRPAVTASDRTRQDPCFDAGVPFFFFGQLLGAAGCGVHRPAAGEGAGPTRGGREFGFAQAHSAHPTAGPRTTPTLPPASPVAFEAPTIQSRRDRLACR